MDMAKTILELPVKLQKELLDYITKNNVPKERQDKILAAVKEAYAASLYDPEEPVGVVTAQSLSEPMTQMSLDASERIIVKHNGRIGIAPIGAFTDQLLERFGAAAADGWDIADLSGHEVFVPALQPDEKIGWHRVLAFSRHAAPAKLLRIRTRSGRAIAATASHSFVTRKANKVVPVAGSALRPGDRIPALRALPEHCIDSIETAAVVSAKWAKKPLPAKLLLDERFGWLVGAYLSEGSATKNYTNISNTDPAFLAKTRAAANALQLGINEYDNDRGFSRGHDLRINSTMLSALLERTCGSGSSRKRVPEFAYSAAEPFVAGLLRAYFEGDGNVSVERGVIRASSNSAELLDGIALLLSRFGIFAHKAAGKQSWLIIPGKHAALFRERIGFCTVANASKLDALCAHPAKKDFLDLIPGFDDLLLSAAQKLGEPTRTVRSFTNRQKVGREALLRLIVRFSALAAERGIDLSAELALMKQMHAADVVWDEIASIETVAPSTGMVYDLTVEGCETFTTFDGLVTHNTMRTYHFAGTAGIQVTLGLPRMMEIFDARKEPRTPAMKVYLQPGYAAQSLEKIRQIAESIKEVKARTIVTSTTIDLTDQRIRCALDLDRVRALGIELEKLPKTLKVRNAEVGLEGNALILTPKKKDLRMLQKIKYALFESHLKGIKDISQVVVTKEGSEWVISTLGSNLKKVFEVEGVDATRTTTNHIFEVEEVLGIEAARNAIIEQARFTMGEQGLDVDIRYIILLADLMTVTGEIEAIGRYGISGQKASPLVRASFEETKKHLTAAAIGGETDPLLGTVENIMMNQVAPIGTGAFDLVGRIPEPALEKKTKKAEEAEEKAEKRAKPAAEEKAA